jgi:restriction system protein
VLTLSKYPESFPQEFDLEYNPETKILAINYILPSPEDLPKLKEVKYIATKDEFKENYFSETAQKKLYNEAIYQICLRTVHELFDTDTVNGIDSIAFNGIVKTIDTSTGKEIAPCILSLHTTKESFQEINLSLVKPKDCFKKLKGVGSSSLYNLAPVAPIIPLNKEDKRFIDSYGVISGVDDTTNVAAMDWQDFEHMVRELFEKEFASNGGEVKVTQGSKDGGVDAIAFDPDPIRGGKIIIQAKRYTNTVGVSAVRDLYGTVLNEGANKGILISTADYGPDAYDFAKDKPLTLMNGSNLLYLLEKHGRKAKIDLKEAKKVLAESC